MSLFIIDTSLSVIENLQMVAWIWNPNHGKRIRCQLVAFLPNR